MSVRLYIQVFQRQLRSMTDIQEAELRRIFLAHLTKRYNLVPSSRCFPLAIRVNGKLAQRRISLRLNHLNPVKGMKGVCV